MKAKLLVPVCMLLLCLTLPGYSYALSNRIDISLDKGSGDTTVYSPAMTGDLDTLDVALSFSHFFKELETDETPYAAREFLQHPSSISAGFRKNESDHSYTNGYKSDNNWDAIAIGAMYFTSLEPYATGVGLTYVAYDIESVLASGVTSYTMESDETDLILTLNQYLAAGVMLGLEYRMADINSDRSALPNDTVAHDATILRIGASALIDRLLLSGYYVDGEDDWPTGYDDEDEDISGLGLDVGVFITQKTGMFISYEKQEYSDIDSSTDDTNIRFGIDHYLSERAYIKGHVTLHEQESKTLYETKETMIGIGGGVLF